MAVVFLDFDHFKIINDSFGHAFGDLLLRHAAERLRAQFVERDTVARCGGDTFAILLTSGKDERGASAAAKHDAVITTVILNMAKTLGLAVVAEGVETEAQLEFLRENGCETVQGFYVGKPGQAEEIERKLRAEMPAREVA